MSWRVMDRYDTYEAAREQFEWDFPESYNPAVDFLRKHDDRDQTALEYHSGSQGSSGETGFGDLKTVSFRELDTLSDRLAAGLASLGVEAGDRVAVSIPQKPGNPITHLANWKLGAVSVPLTVLFGTDALQYRLEDSDARVAVIDPAVSTDIDAIRDDCPALESVVELGESPGDDNIAFEALLEDHEAGIDIYESTVETATAIMYTSGSTGPPKGVLHSHALWLGRAGAAYNYFDQGLEDAILWTPADWAWGAALGGTLFAAWHHGCSVLGWPRTEFDPAKAFELLADANVTHAFMPPTALRLLMGVDEPAATYDLSLETFASAGEPMTPEIVDWVERTFEDVSINEFYGQTELNLCVANCSNWFETRPGSMGKLLPGYDVAVIDPGTDERLPAGEIGELVVRAHDRRVFFDEYWGLPEKTAAKQVELAEESGNGSTESSGQATWFRTGDLVERDEDGYLWFHSRTDDVILTKGYRVGPMEVESAILEHPAVEQVGVVGIPDETIGEAIKAFVQPTGELSDPDTVRTEIRNRVREQLAEYEYPNEIAFLDELPTTSTGKIRRESLRE